ncbi:uncharacterized protein [Populus alba]|uniref:uncharacterized protein n=1 Tax=Populus alba TaxID=43335 RepID=UPI00158CE1C1|nr:uncharacterized protein LOC118030654 [Populus alba]
MKKEKTKEDTEMSISISNCKFILIKPTSCQLALITEVHLKVLQELARWKMLKDLFALVVVERGAAFCVRGGPGTERLAMECLERIESDKKSLVDFYKRGCGI